MPHMPLDILVEVRASFSMRILQCGQWRFDKRADATCPFTFQVFSFMHPRDLLSLARTTRDFRTFLSSRSSAPFWKAARKNVEGLPDCPQYLSEPAYANLMFFAHCHVSVFSYSSCGSTGWLNQPLELPQVEHPEHRVRVLCALLS